VWTGKPIRLAGTGHAVHREQVQAFNRLLAEFLETIT
ncbi:MAG: alpha/beta hydrolase, partial [Delftia acidovorans]